MNWPALLAIILVPITMRVKELSIGDVATFDVYTWYKSAMILVLGACACYRRLPPWPVVALVSASCVLSAFPSVSWWGFPNQYFGGAVLIALVALAANAPTPDQIVWALAVGSAPIVLFTVYPEAIPWSLITHGFDVRVQGGDLPASTLYNSNFVGLYCATVAPIFFSRRLLVPFMMLCLALAYCHSLSGAIAMIVGIAASIWFDGRKKLAALMAIGAAVGLYLYWKPGVSGRWEIWQHTFPMLTSFGSGLGMFPLQYPQTGGELVDKPHSFYLQILHAFGFFGMGVCMSLLGKWKIKCRSLASGIVGCLVAGLANDLYIGVAPILAILFGASYATVERRQGAVAPHA